jgi:hypothetical protein
MVGLVADADQLPLDDLGMLTNHDMDADIHDDYDVDVDPTDDHIIDDSASIDFYIEIGSGDMIDVNEDHGWIGTKRPVRPSSKSTTRSARNMVVVRHFPAILASSRLSSQPIGCMPCWTVWIVLILNKLQAVHP